MHVPLGHSRAAAAGLRPDGGKQDADRDGPELDGYPAILCEGGHA